ncbi:uncharacterized protein TRIADDRAFT_33106 [Trichoplax adhaerens]|uniref:Transporter n=1 Tax=Trichoplax adhaerens TaxID=10228 RepID=B3SC79_TRIAD|nr:hypothetical protein TRIADDRAFT_33106 [Trichoplax adhaerens]EDV19673.1 hypothetical protein TRIADDRAFT_33106 [Trichoplax adhaerens]|eukprot:XP_002117830.1 hypothetical protein TRIADDRAFT_33106 [Trichoplax adhaerens]
MKDDQNEIYWGNWMEFLLSCIGYAVGYSNVLRFPYICYKHGGGAFLIPYFVSVLLVGVPTLHMELALGQYMRMGPGTLWKHVCPVLKGLGIAMIVSCILNVVYFHIVLAWSLFYFYASFFPQLPWASCNNTWNTHECYVTGDVFGNVSGKAASVEFLDLETLRIDEGGALYYDLVPHLVITLLIAWTITYCAMCMGIESSGKVVYFTATAPYVMLFSLLIRAVTLPGATQGIIQFLVPDFSKLGTLDPWADALGQVLSAIGIGFGAIITLGSYNRRDNKCGRDSAYICTITSFTSITAGLVCFAVLGYLSRITGKPIDDLISEEIVIAFIAYPEAIAKLPSPHFWAIAFFFMLLLLGMDSIYGMIETLITTAVRFSKGRWENRKPMVTFFICAGLFTIGLIFTTRSGLFWLIVVDTNNAGPIVLGLTLFEVLAVSFVYGADRLGQNVKDMTGSRPNSYWILTWKYVCPIGAGFNFVVSLAKTEPMEYLGKPVEPWGVGIGILLTLLVLIWIPLGAIYQLYTAEGSLKQVKHLSSYSVVVVRFEGL